MSQPSQTWFMFVEITLGQTLACDSLNCFRTCKIVNGCGGLLLVGGITSMLLHRLRVFPTSAGNFTLTTGMRPVPQMLQRSVIPPSVGSATCSGERQR